MSPRHLLLLVPLLLAACDLSDVPGLGPDPRIAQREADGKAIGGACRHGLRSIEDCYTLNPKAAKAHVFTGWKDMDQYMRDNKIEGVVASASAPADEDAVDTKPENKAQTKTVAKVDAKPEPKPKGAPAPH